MQYLVSFALLVAFVAWMAGVYHQLEHLRAAVCQYWGQWCRATHHRNECLADFAETFALFLPQEDPRPAYLRRLAADSDRSLALVRTPRWGPLHGFMGSAEQVLRSAVAQSVQVVENSPVMRGNEPLQRLCSSVSVSLYQQDQLASLFNSAAVEYNAALAAPAARLLAPLFGFEAADPLDMNKKEHPQR